MDQDWNTPEALHAWVDETLDNASDLTDTEICLMRQIGYTLTNQGKLRGDISEAWRAMVPRINMAVLDLYL